MGIKDKSFSHYTFNAGENKGEAPTFFSKSELEATLNIENRGNGLSTRYGSTVLNVDGDGFPDPIAANPVGRSVFYFPYGSPTTHETIWAAGSSIYTTPATPLAIKTGLASTNKFQGAKAGEIFYLSNGSDPAYYFNPALDATTLYTVGYDTPAAFTAAPNLTGTGAMVTGVYSYYVTLYDLATFTESNPQDVVVTGTVTNPASDSILLASLPIDPEDRSTHWRIYRKDPSGVYYYRLAQVAYNAGAPTYTDTSLLTGQSYIVLTDNFKPDPSSSICLHNDIMVYMFDNTVTWSKTQRYQNVPTYNRENLFDEATGILVGVSYGDALVVFKSSCIYIFTGSLNGSYKVKRISSSVGTNSPQSVTVTPSGIFFLDNHKRPRFIDSTDFSYEDLRDSTDISYKFRRKFDLIAATSLPACHAVLWQSGTVNQWRLFVPIDQPDNIPNYCFIFDLGLSRRNNGDSSWFTLRYNMRLTASVAVSNSNGVGHIYCPDDYGLMWELENTISFFDGDEFWRAEADGDITINTGFSTIDLPDEAMEINRFVGMDLVMYDSYTFDEIFRSRVVSNTATQFTVEDVIAALETEDPAVSVGGYLTYFASANFTHDRAGANRPFKMSMLFGHDLGSNDAYVFTNYDFNQTFNYTYEYINNPSNPSRTPKGDVYLIDLSGAIAIYDDPDSQYNESEYGETLYAPVNFLLRAYYLFQHVSWGVITREPSKPFSYIGATLYYQPKGLIT